MRKRMQQICAAALSLLMIVTSSGISGLGGIDKVLAAEGVQVTTSGSTITIGNEYIERTFSMTDGKLKTDSITNKRTGDTPTVFTPGEGSEEFIVKTVKDGDTPVISMDALDRTGWVATADSYQNASGNSDGPAQNLLDGNLQSIWHSKYNTSGAVGNTNFPYNVIITLNGTKTFQSFSYTPRQEGENTNGNLRGYELYAATSSDGSALDVNDAGWTLISKGNFEYNGVNPIYVNLSEAVTANQVKLVALSANNGANFGGGAEFNLYADKAPISTVSRSFASSELTLNGDPVVENTTATINDVNKTGKKITFNFNTFTYKEVDYTISEVIVMYEGDHFMRKYLEISVPEAQRANAVIDYIDLESLNVNADDAQWTIPTDAGGIVQMSQFKANLGQPFYIQGMFFGCEFPETDNEIVDGTGYMRYYTGKSFERFGLDNQLTTDGKYVTWQTVVGAARSTENEVIQADFYDYIDSIATPSEFRIQYNSWFDNMMLIDDNNILESFIEIDKELNNAEVRPLDSYVVDDGWNNYNYTSVVDASRSGTTLNESGFWEFNTKFPDGLTPSSELVQKFGSNFGVWIGPRGGYNFYGQLADILTANGTGSKAGGSIDVADRVYVENFGDMAVDWQKKYGVNYWKWDGFADTAQYSQWSGTDGVPGYANNHMTGGYQNMYHVTDLWEAWIDLFERVRQSEKEDGINNLWISLTCYVNPSPWFLQWANSVWIQCTADQADAGSSTSKMDRQMTYRDACYYDFLKNHEFQFPLANIYNHDPVYGKEGTSMTLDTATDEQFQNYLYMLSTRGTTFWELYYSDSIMTEGKYEVTGEFLEWAEENSHMLRNAKMFGQSPNTGTVLGGNGSGENNAYGFACFDGTDGLISVRNPATSERTVTITFDRTLGVPENAGTLQYHLEHSYNLTEGTATTGTLTYGDTVTFTLKPDEVRILRVSADGDTTAPEFARAYTDGNKTIIVKFNEKVYGGQFTVSGAEVASVTKSADDITYRIELAQAPADGTELTVTAGDDVKDMAGNAPEEKSVKVVYRADNQVVYTESAELAGTAELADADESLNTINGFTVTAEVATTGTGAVISQEGGYELGIQADGKAYFTVNGATAVSDTVVNDGTSHAIVGVKENNGMLKIYVDAELEGSAYNKDNRYFEVPAAAIVAGNDDFQGTLSAKVMDAAYGYDAVEEAINGPSAENLALNKTAAIGWTDGSSDSIGNGQRPPSMAVDGAKDNTSLYGEFGYDNNNKSSWLQVDLGGVYKVESLNLYRYFGDGRTYNGTVIALAEDEEDFADHTATVIYNSDSENVHGFGAGEDATYAETAAGKTFELAEKVRARYVRVYMKGSGSGTTNHIVELEVYGINKEVGPTPDLTALNARIAELEQVSTEGKTTSSAAEFTKLLKRAKALAVSEYATQDEVTAMVAALADAENILKERGDVTELQNLVYACMSVKEEEYTEATWEVFAGALADAQDVIADKDDKTQAEIDAAGDALKAAKNGLVDVAEVVNLALNKTAAARWAVDDLNAATNNERPASMAVDGNRSTGNCNVNYADFGADNRDESSYLQVDLGNIYKVSSIQLYRYWNGGRIYKGTVIALAENEADFADKTATVIYNSDVDNTHGFGTGEDATYAETGDGKTFTLSEKVKARYVRVYMHGSNGGQTNHIVELEVYGVDRTYEGNVNYEALNNRITELEAVSTEGKTTGSVVEFEAILESAKIVAANTDATQAEVDAKVAELADAEAILKNRGDVTALKELIESFASLSEDAYTAETWAVYAEALEAAEAAVKDNSDLTQEQVDALKTALQTAKDNLADAAYITSLVVTPPTKTTYVTGEELDKTGMSVKAVYSDSTEVDVTADAEVSALDSTEAGIKTITVTYGGKTETFNVTVLGLTQFDDAILVKNAKANSEQLPIKWVNDGGATWAFDDEAHWWHSRYEDFDQKGEGEVDDGKPTTDNPIWLQTGFDGVQYVKKITYLPRQGTQEYGRVKDYSIAVANMTDPTAVPTDSDFTVVKSGTLQNVATEQTIMLDEFTAATHVRLIVTSVYANGGTPHVAAQRIKIFGTVVNSISLTAPAKLEYTQGENLILNGMKVEATYSDETKADVTTGAAVTGYDPAVAGTQTVTVSYAGKTATFEVSVKEAPKTLTGITVTAPTKTEYTVGDTLDTTGMVVKAVYSNGDETVVTENATLSGFDSSTAGTKTVTVTYEGKSATFEVTIKEPAAEVDTSELEAEIAKADAIDLTAYKDGAEKDAFIAALAAAKEAEEKAESQDAVDAAKAALADAAAKLIPAEPETPVVSISFDKEADSIIIKEEKKLEVTVDPDDAKVEWSSDNEDVLTVDTDGKIKAMWPGEATVTAKAGDKTAGIKITVYGVEKIYNDVKNNDWFYDATNWAYINDVMSGYGDGSFGPGDSLARAQFAVIMYRIAGTPEVEFEERFPDVKEGDWFADAVIWANDNEIITGYTATGMFGPADKITREQIAAILYRYAKAERYDVEASDDLADFPDADKVSGFAQDAMKWAVGSGLIKGDNGKLNPQGNANRAEAATLIKRFCEACEK